MMKKIVLYICFIMSVSQMFSQMFNNRYNFGFPASYLSDIAYINCKMTVLGIAEDTLPPHFIKALLADVTVDGNISDIKTFRDSTVDYFTLGHSLLQTKNNGYAFCSLKNVSNFARIVILNANKEVLINKIFTPMDTNSLAFYPTDLIETKGQGFLMLGNLQIGNAGKAFLLMTDSLGNELWRQYYGNAVNAYNSSFTLIPHPKKSGHYLIGGSKIQQNNGSPQSSQTWILEVDSLGNMKNEWFDADIHTFDATDLQPTLDGGYVYGSAYTTQADYGGGNQYYYWYKGSVTKLDSLYHKEWQILLGDACSDFYTCFKAVKTLSNGDILAAGSVYDTTYFHSNGAWRLGWLVKISANGNLIWDRRFSIINNLTDKQWFNDMELGENGSIYLCGEADQYSNPVPYEGENAWIVKTDSFGCLVPGCQNVGIESPTETKQVLSLYPNPTADMLYIYFHDAAAQSGDYAFIIRDLQGKEIVPKTALSNSTTYLFSTSQLARGMYVLELWKKGAFVEVQKFVKE